MFVRLWSFQARAGQTAAFLAAYGPEGDWAALFRRSAGYLGTELLESTGDATRFVTIDRWESAVAWQDFLRAWPDEYAALDRLCHDLTDAESDLGEFRR